MKRILLCLSLCLLPLLFLTGCWDSIDPEEREYIVTIGVDKTDEGYAFSLAPAKSSAQDPKRLQTTAQSLASALVQLDTTNSKRTDLGQTKVLLLGASMLGSQESLMALLHELSRTQSISENLLVLATEEHAADCIEEILNTDNNTGLFLWDFYRNAKEDIAITEPLDLNTLLTQLAEQEGYCILPRIQTTEEGLALGGGMLLADGTYHSTLTEEQELSFLLLTGDAQGAILEDANTPPTALRILHSHASLNMEATEHAYVANIQLRLTADLCSTPIAPIFSSAQMQTLETLFSNIIKEKIINTITVAQQQQTLEAFGFGAKLRQSYGDFATLYDLPLHPVVSVELNLSDTGRIR